MKQEKDKIKFPFISLFPSGDYTNVNKNYTASNIGIPTKRQALLYNDDTLSYKGQSSTMQNFYQMLMYNIPYAISCWSTNRIQALQLVQELMFWFNAQREVIVKYKHQTYKCNIQIGDTIGDRSSYISYSDQGNIYRFDIAISIDAPVYRTQNYLNITDTNLEIQLKEGEN